MRKVFGFFGVAAVVAMAACSSGGGGGTSDAGTDGGNACGAKAEKAEYCSSCTPIAELQCTAPKPLSACCVYTANPKMELQRATGLKYNSAPDNNPAGVDLSCLDAPGDLGASQTVTVEGYVKLFSTGNDSAGVKIEIHQEGPDGAVGALVGAAVTTDSTPVGNACPMDGSVCRNDDLLSKCPVGGCIYRKFTYAGVPTEKPLIIKTSDAGSGQKWAELYDYNIVFRTSEVVNGVVKYDPSAVAATDLNTVASAAGGFTIKSDRGLLAGEVRDCKDVRLAYAMVNTDVRPEGDIFYFGENESDPLPDKMRTQGTSKLGLFGALNYPTGRPIRISATGISGGKTVLVGTYTVQVFKGAVTALSLRGRRPWQK
jgi:hypothetical protein